MQLSVTLNGITSFLQVDPAQSIRSLKNHVSTECGAKASSLVLLYNARHLDDTETILSSGIKNLGAIAACVRVLGGGGNMSENDRAMAMANRNSAMICRRCYARLAPRADKCRKTGCGSKDLRPKKLLKSMKK